MRIGKTTSRGWVGLKMEDKRISFGVVPRRLISIDFDPERVLKVMVEKDRGDHFVTAVRQYVRHWWSLGRPMPWTIIRRARQYAVWQRGVHHNMTPPPWPFGQILDDPDPRASVKI